MKYMQDGADKEWRKVEVNEMKQSEGMWSKSGGRWRKMKQIEGMWSKSRGKWLKRKWSEGMRGKWSKNEGKYEAESAEMAIFVLRPTYPNLT